MPRDRWTNDLDDEVSNDRECAKIGRDMGSCIPGLGVIGNRLLPLVCVNSVKASPRETPNHPMHAPHVHRR
jgi:hypothetical protein